MIVNLMINETMYLCQFYFFVLIFFDSINLCYFYILLIFFSNETISFVLAIPCLEGQFGIARTKHVITG